ncbi:MAG TPA: hypothetical protein VGJ87_14975 [Roseiflexaceae bacterium]|jgi:hypothetical protein
MADRFTASIRPYLLAGVLRFVRAARTVEGVGRIALIGSLATDKRNPKDADLLITIRDTADLAPLAMLGRKLQGHAQQRNRGGEVFLCAEEGVYLGRTCPWKDCRPFVRLRCDAQHCGLRSYLHDDLQTITLPPSLIATPPIELWPQLVARVPVPDDVEQLLLTPLRAAG